MQMFGFPTYLLKHAFSQLCDNAFPNVFVSRLVQYCSLGYMKISKMFSFTQYFLGNKRMNIHIKFIILSPNAQLKVTVNKCDMALSPRLTAPMVIQLQTVEKVDSKKEPSKQQNGSV